MKRQIDDTKRYQQLAWEFYHKQQKLKSIQKKFDELKREFEEEMECLFRSENVKRMQFKSDELDSSGTLSVKMVERTSIEWDAKKIEKRVPREVAKKVIRKQYYITDMNGLVRYLKSCGVDPNIFKMYLRIEKSVDQNEVDRLGELGQISVRAISGCYIVKCQKPYFTLSVKKGNDDGEQ